MEKKILSVYSGKLGCMCGCNGKYSYTTESKVEAGQARGYEVSDNEVNDRSVKIISNKVLKNPDAKFDEDANCMYVKDETKNRMQAIYYAK